MKCPFICIHTYHGIHEGATFFFIYTFLHYVPGVFKSWVNHLDMMIGWWTKRFLWLRWICTICGKFVFFICFWIGHDTTEEKMTMSPVCLSVSFLFCFVLFWPIINLSSTFLFLFFVFVVFKFFLLTCFWISLVLSKKSIFYRTEVHGNLS